MLPGDTKAVKLRFRAQSMNPFPRTVVPIVCLLVVVCSFGAFAANGQTPAPQNRVTQAVNMNQMVTLRGNVNPLARAAYDQGAVVESEPMNRMLLLLQRSANQEASLRQLLDQQQDKSSANYHKWLTPEDFGQRFGPSDADVQAVTDWLTSQGFTGIKVAPGRVAIEFSGNAGEVQSAFQTRMHHYLVNQKMYSANATDPQIPEALAPVVAGVVSLNNFPRKSYLRELGTFQKSRATGEVTPLFTFNGCQTGHCFALGPADFATIYNTAPMLAANPPVDGTGVTIAIVGDSNINVQDVTDFRTMFGLPLNFTSQNVIVNGPDPGIWSDEGEADLDVEWSGAVAPGATIDFVVSEPTETTAGIDLSAIYIVANNLAAVMSESFGECEQGLGTTGNAFYNQLWEQAAAQGITVMLSAGDGGSAGCDDFHTEQMATRGLAVSGYASTPYDVAVGGTDFDQVGREATFWNTTPTSTTPPVPSSALSYIPEVPWNDSCAQNGLTGCNSGNLLDIVAGSGGASTIYSKPAWQMGVAGVPNDSRRDLPDISLFASNGFNDSFYIVCQSDALTLPGQNCSLTNLGFTFEGVGGTSASAPAFAGIMALVNQKTGQRQGNANYVLYSLVKKTGASCNSNGTTLPGASCTFYDVTKGNNSVPCTGGSPNCSSSFAITNGVLFTTSGTTQAPAYTSGTGYDLATGLGSVNAQNLVNNWNTVNLTATTTTLTLNNNSAVNVSHGTSVPVQVGVMPTTAKGEVSLVAQLANGSTVGLGDFTLGTNGTVSGTTSALPGGTNYSVYAHYAGDGTNAPSDSSPVSVSVNPEASATLITLPTFNAGTGVETANTPATLVYGSPYIMRVDVGKASAQRTFPPQPVCQPPACPTGTVTITDNGSSAAPNGGAFGLNSWGYTEDQPVQFEGGQHTIVANYSGDSSFNAGSSTYALTVTQAPTTTTIPDNDNAVTGTVGVAFSLNITTQTNSFGAIPSGTYTVYDGGVALPTTSQIWNGQTGTFDPGHAFAQATATVTFAAPGSHILTVKYSGDANYAGSTSTNSYSINVNEPTTTSLTASSLNIIAGNPITLTALVDTTVKSPAPSRNVSFYGSRDGYFPGTVNYSVVTDAQGNAELQATLSVTPFQTEELYAYFGGDSNYATSDSATLDITVVTPDFSFGPSSGTLNVVAGQSGTLPLTLTPVTNLTSSVQLAIFSTGMPSGSTYSFTPNPATLSNATPSVVNFSVNVPAPSPSSSGMVLPRRWAGTFPVFRGGWLALGFAAGLGMMIALFGRGRRCIPVACGLAVVCAVSLAVGCGGGSSGAVAGGGGGNGGGGGGAQLLGTSTTITTNGSKVAFPSPVQFTITVTPASGAIVPTGTISLVEVEGSSQSSQTLMLTNGQAQLQIVALSVGAHTFFASYNGDSHYQASTSQNLIQVITGSTTVAISATTGIDSHQIFVTINVQ